MIACAIGGVYLSFGNFVVVKAVAYCRRLLLRHELFLSMCCCFQAGSTTRPLLARSRVGIHGRGLATPKQS